MAIRSFAHKGLEAFFLTGSKAGIQPRHAPRLQQILFLLQVAASPSDVDAPGLRLHSLHGDRLGFWAVTVQSNWRVTFRFEAADAFLIDYVDYH